MRAERFDGATTPEHVARTDGDSDSRDTVLRSLADGVPLSLIIDLGNASGTDSEGFLDAESGSDNWWDNESSDE